MNKLYKWSKNKMKMIINSDFTTFNNQTNLITSGNCISNTQYSNYIRKYDNADNGKLFNYDLQYFSISEGLKNYIKSLDKEIILYEFFVYNKNQKNIIGWIIDNDNTMEIYVNNQYRCNYDKRFKTLEYCKKILVEKNNTKIL